MKHNQIVKKFAKKLTIITIALVILMLFAGAAFAENNQGVGPQYNLPTPSGDLSKLNQWGLNAAKLFGGFVGIVLILALIYVGYKIMTSRGKHQNKAEAYEYLGDIAIGTGVILGAAVIAGLLLWVFS